MSSVDDRFTDDLISDVVAVLARHGYRAPSGEGSVPAIGATVNAVLQLVDAYEGVSSRHVPGEVDPLLSDARERFAEVLAAGVVPSVRAIRRELHVGHPRAVRIRGALAER